jgi:hypothetical protein
MKEITRKLYKKPVMLALMLLVAAVVLVGVSTRSRAALPIVPKGDDLFETTGDGQTYHNFANAPIPAGTFTSNSGSPSLAYNQNVPLVGVPLGAGSDTDTVIARNDDVNVPGTTSLTMTGLSLDSISPLTITYANGTTEQWKMHVSLSAFKSSTGSMAINSNGTFDSTLKVWPKFTFTSQLDQDTVTYDTGSGSGLSALSSAIDFNEGGVVIEEPVPMPAPTIAPCAVAHDDTSTFANATVVGVSDAAAASSCPPVTLTSTNSPWQICNGHFCIPRPITEAELLASHNASPPGTRKRVAVQVVGAAVSK